MLPVVAAAVALFSFFTGGCSPRKPDSHATPEQGPPQSPRDYYMSPRVDPMEKYQGGYIRGSRF